MEYTDGQIGDLEAAIDRRDCDVILHGTPFGLGRVIDITKAIVRGRYVIEEGDAGFGSLPERDLGPAHGQR